MQLFAESLPPLTGIAGMTFTGFCAAWHDWKSWSIPNRLLLPSVAAALMLACFAVDGIGWQASLAGGLCGLGIFLPLYLLNVMGAGDVKLLATLGLYAGPLLTLDIALLSALAGGIWAVALLFGRSYVGAQISIAIQVVLGAIFYQWVSLPFSLLRKNPREGLMPYGVVIAVGMLMAVALASNLAR